MKKLLSDLVHVLSIQFVVLLLIIGLSAFGYYFRKDIQISYHKWGEASTLKSMKKYSMQGQERKYHRVQDKFMKHRKALLELGYLEEQMFDTQYLSTSTPEFNKMLAEFREIYSNCYLSFGDRGNHKISITCQKDWIPIWEELIKKYDVPPDDPNKEKM